MRRRQQAKSTRTLSADEIRYLSALQRRQKAARARDDLLEFAEFMMPHPDFPDDVTRSAYLTAPHRRAIAPAALELVESGKIRRLIINVPPRHGKSELSSRLFPAWLCRPPPRAVD